MKFKRQWMQTKERIQNKTKTGCIHQSQQWTCSKPVGGALNGTAHTGRRRTAVSVSNSSGKMHLSTVTWLFDIHLCASLLRAPPLGLEECFHWSDCFLKCFFLSFACVLLVAITSHLMIHYVFMSCSMVFLFFICTTMWTLFWIVFVKLWSFHACSCFCRLRRVDFGLMVTVACTVACRSKAEKLSKNENAQSSKVLHPSGFSLWKQQSGKVRKINILLRCMFM